MNSSNHFFFFHFQLGKKAALVILTDGEASDGEIICE
jgi:hypothetical protein